MLKLDIYNCQIQKRPSAVSKTPYVADGLLDDKSVKQIHTPALGCCGLCDKDANILVTKNEKPKICSYTAQIAYFYEPKIGENIYIGINPKLAEMLVHKSLQTNILPFLRDPREFAREKHIENTNSRFDFAGIDATGQPFVLEVKNVPLADYVDCTEQEKKRIHPELYDNLAFDEKVAYFPDGYRKTAKAPISPRALKHLHDLQTLVQRGYRAIMCYVIQRKDAKYFQPSVIDSVYRAAFYEAKKNGVEMHAIQFTWDERGAATYIGELFVL
jgi:DNA-binding sugar fermentation-stimulating protein